MPDFVEQEIARRARRWYASYVRAGWTFPFSGIDAAARAWGRMRRKAELEVLQ